MKISITKQDKFIFAKIGAILLSIIYCFSGLYTIAHFENIGFINSRTEVLIYLSIHTILWYILFFMIVFKYINQTFKK